MLHGLFNFLQVSASDGYDIGMGVKYVSDTHTQFKHLESCVWFARMELNRNGTKVRMGLEWNEVGIINSIPMFGYE